jgi:hypothetical protein
MLSIPLLSTPPTHQIASQSHQHLLLASISTLYASALAARRRKERREREMVEGGLLPSDVLKSHLRGEGQAGGGGTALGEEEERELREEVRRRLDEMGERVGGDLAERSVLLPLGLVHMSVCGEELEQNAQRTDLNEIPQARVLPTSLCRSSRHRKVHM